MKNEAAPASTVIKPSRMKIHDQLEDHQSGVLAVKLGSTYPGFPPTPSMWTMPYARMPPKAPATDADEKNPDILNSDQRE